jgi:multimeric flavodoxin WrbA
MSRTADDRPVIPDERSDDLQGLENADNADLVIFACPIRSGRNPGHARASLEFLSSDAARGIYAEFGFTPAEG